MNRKIIFLVSAAIITGIIYSSVFIVGEGSYAIITQFGKPVRIIKQAGLNFKLPAFLQKVNRLDKRADIFDTQPIQLLLRDKNPVILTSYICWRISEPLLFFESLIAEDIAKQKLSDMINSQLGSTLGDYTMDNIINTDEKSVKLKEIEARILERSNEKTREKYGIEIVSVGIRRINYPSIVEDSVYERMRAEREKEAKKYRAEGMEEAEKIKAEADKEVASIYSEAYKKAEIIKGKGDKESMRIYAEAYGKDREFFKFLKSLEALKNILNSESTLILSTESEIFKYLNYNDKKENK